MNQRLIRLFLLSLLLMVLRDAQIIHGAWQIPDSLAVLAVSPGNGTSDVAAHDTRIREW